MAPGFPEPLFDVLATISEQVKDVEALARMAARLAGRDPRHAFRLRPANGQIRFDGGAVQLRPAPLRPVVGEARWRADGQDDEAGGEPLQEDAHTRPTKVDAGEQSLEKGGGSVVGKWRWPRQRTLSSARRQAPYVPGRSTAFPAVACTPISNPLRLGNWPSTLARR